MFLSKYGSINIFKAKIYQIIVNDGELLRIVNFVVNDVNLPTTVTTNTRTTFDFEMRTKYRAS